MVTFGGAPDGSGNVTVTGCENVIPAGW